MPEQFQPKIVSQDEAAKLETGDAFANQMEAFTDEKIAPVRTAIEKIEKAIEDLNDVREASAEVPKAP